MKNGNVTLKIGNLKIHSQKKRPENMIWFAKLCVQNMWTDGEKGRMEPKDQYFTEISIQACELNMEICYPETKILSKLTFLYLYCFLYSL